MRKELLGNEHVDVAVSLNGLAVVLSAIGKGREAEATFREALAIKRNRFGNEHREVADTLLGLGTVMYAAGKPAEAELVLREALALQRKLFGNDHLTLATCLGRLATALTMQHKLEEAELLHREALARRKKLLGNTHPKVANSIFSLATLLEDQGKLVEAETLFRELVAMLKERLGNTDPSVASSVHQLANVLEKQGKAAEAETLRRRSIGDLDAALKGAPGDTNLAAQLHFDRARAYVCLKDYEKAVPEFEKAIELDPNSPVARNTLAWYYANGPINICSPEKALALALKAVELTGRTNANYLNTLGVVYYRLGQLTNALETLEAGLKEGGTATTAYDFLFLAMSCQRLADPSQAQDYFRKATNWLASQSSLRSNQKAELAAYRAEAEQLLAKQSTK
jgi:tetratricopeptide (TPR) repeat protein